MSISVDSREASKNQKIVEALRSNGLEVVVKPLPADYAVEVEDGYVVERKTSIDLAHSIRSGRLWNELEKMKMLENSFKPILLVEGSLALLEKFTEWSPSSIVGALNSVMFDWNVPVVFVPSVRWTVAYLTSLAKRAVLEEKKPRPLKIKEKATSPVEYAVMVVESLPGVSAVKARNILRHFKTLRRLFTASERQLMELEGIGEKTARKTVEVMDAVYDESGGIPGA